MRLTIVLRKQRLGFQFKKHWHLQSKRKILKTSAQSALEKQGITIYEPMDILNPNRYEKIKIIGMKPELPIIQPNWNAKACYVFNDYNVLLEGLDQAKILTNTVEVMDEVPEKLNNPVLPDELNERVKQIIFASHLFDAQQEKLPKRKDPERPAWNFRRDYGVTRKRAQMLLLERLLQLIEFNSDLDVVQDRSILNNLYFKQSFEKFNKLLQFQLKADTLLLSTKALTPMFNIDTTTMELPNISPVDPTVTLKPEHVYDFINVYPISAKNLHPHTVIAYYDDDVKNLYEEPVTEPQFLGRTLLKTFTVASCCAKNTYGDDVKQLPQPITIQCVQTNGQMFDFGIFQLNTLDTKESRVKNVWYKIPQMALFTSCAYDTGRPTLKGYNSNVFRHLLAFYRNN